MKGLYRYMLLGTFLVGNLISIGCHGTGSWYRDRVDVCAKERYSYQARQSLNDCFAAQISNGQTLDQTIWNHHFETGTENLHASGMAKLELIIARRPEVDTRIFLQTAHDLPLIEEKIDDSVKGRRELDAKRAETLDKVLTSLTAGRGLHFEVLVHDPIETPYAASAASRVITSHGSSVSGSLGSGGGGSGGANAGGAQTGGGALSIPGLSGGGVGATGGSSNGTPTGAPR
jgi:hypothetical protein